MAFRDYRKYPAADLKKFFQIEIEKAANLFEDFTPSGHEYPELQQAVTNMSVRLRLSRYDNEATRGSLLVSRILWAAGELYELGVFFEPTVTYPHDDAERFPHSLNGLYDGALSLDEIDLLAPVISVVEVKRSSLSDGLGQCIAEMFTTLHVFEQEKVYGIITDGELWEFLLLENNIISVDTHNYHIRSVSDIVERIGYIANSFKSEKPV
ncbi:MAG: hypothetical protein AAF639_12925 [Chloroflexota bacterium]